MKKLLCPVELEIFGADTSTCLPLIMAGSAVKAGFPSPADDFVEQKIDLNVHLIQHPAATFFARVKGQSMVCAGIDEGDLLVVDRAVEPKSGNIAVCFVDGEFTIKRIKVDNECCYLVAECDGFQPIRVDSSNEFVVWGVVTYVIKKL